MDTKNYYEEYWRNGGQHISEYMAFKQNIIKNIDEKFLVFDFGGGDGQTVELMRNKDNVVVGDISQIALIEAKKKGFKTVIIDDNFQFESLKKYDCILLLDCLEHFINPEDIFKNISRNLKHNAYVYISVPNMLNIFSRVFFLSGRYIDFCDKSHLTNDLFSEHIQLFSKKKLEKLIYKYGYDISEKNFYIPKNIEFFNHVFIRYIWLFLYKINLNNLFPSLFSLSFFYVCRKN